MDETKLRQNVWLLLNFLVSGKEKGDYMKVRIICVHVGRFKFALNLKRSSDFTVEQRKTILL